MQLNAAELLSPEEQAFFQIRLSLQWACIDFLKYTNFAQRCRQQDEPDLASFFDDLAVSKKTWAMRDLEILLPRMIPTFAGWHKDVESMPLTDTKSMILNAMHSELDQKGYLHRTVARKLREIGEEELAMIYDASESQAEINFKKLQTALDQYLASEIKQKHKYFRAGRANRP